MRRTITKKISIEACVTVDAEITAPDHSVGDEGPIIQDILGIAISGVQPWALSDKGQREFNRRLINKGFTGHQALVALTSVPDGLHLSLDIESQILTQVEDDLLESPE